jgi:hypothetical protein
VLDRDIAKWLDGTAHGVLVATEAKFRRRSDSRVAGYVIFHTNNGTMAIRKARILLIINLNDHYLIVPGDHPGPAQSC